MGRLCNARARSPAGLFWGPPGVSGVRVCRESSSRCCLELLRTGGCRVTATRSRCRSQSSPVQLWCDEALRSPGPSPPRAHLVPAGRHLGDAQRLLLAPEKQEVPFLHQFISSCHQRTLPRALALVNQLSSCFPPKTRPCTARQGAGPSRGRLQALRGLGERPTGRLLGETKQRAPG